MLEICQHKANNTNMIQISMANWASSKFAVQITPNAISLILKKRTDLESMTDNELFAKRSESKAGGRPSNLGPSMLNKEWLLTEEIIKIKT